MRLWDTGGGRLRATLEGHRGVVLGVALDGDGRIQLANARACAALGLEEAELLGREWAGREGFTWHATPLDGGGELLMGLPVAVPV